MFEEYSEAEAYLIDMDTRGGGSMWYYECLEDDFDAKKKCRVREPGETLRMKKKECAGQLIWWSKKGSRKGLTKVRKSAAKEKE
mmetsp:Transcript_6021/g.16926  ORF Transcript_6021/g.16926 Transcript_6021/m.16926 type:complete len:84 (+) Transcript_6021:608-859(+)